MAFAFARLFERCNVCQVLWATRSTLVLKKLLPIDECHGYSTEFAFNASFPSFGECHAVNVSQDIDTHRRNSKHENHIITPQIVYR